MKPMFDFLKEMYFPGYMGLLTEKYDSRSGVFDFKPIEPPVFRHAPYLTPRGAHIFISQAGYCLVENVLAQGGFDMTAEEFRELSTDGRMKIVELNQRYRRELPLDRDLKGRMELTNVRWGKLPIVKIDFNIGERAITGSLVGVLAPRPMPQMNADILAPRH
ncbi:MAG: hypothetical protein WCK90_03370 [archaeon]